VNFKYVLGLKMKKISILLIVMMLSLSCTKREPIIISTYQADDSSKSCLNLQSEILYYKTKIDQKITEVNNKTGQNLALGISGAFLIVPWFFMDLSGAERTELESYKMRVERLQVIALDASCNLLPTLLPKLSNNLPKPQKPVTNYQKNDYQLNCDELLKESTFLYDSINSIVSEFNKSINYNDPHAVDYFFRNSERYLVFMPYYESKILKSYKNRYEYLNILIKGKYCNI